MGYEISLNMAWEELQKLDLPENCTISLLTKTYEIRALERVVLQQPSGVQADEFLSVLILRYLVGKSRHGFRPCGDWISFKETEGGKLFWPNFSSRAIKLLVESFEQDPDGLARNIVDDLGGRLIDCGDIAVEVETFPGVFVRVVYWRGDDELPAEATMLFDRGLTEIYIMEDIAALLTLLVDTISMMVSR